MPIIGSPTTITEWSAMIPDIAPHVPQCPTFEMRDYARKAAREFFGTSNYWRSRAITLLTTVADQTSYPFDLPDQAELNRVHVAYNGEDEVHVQIPGEEDDYYPTESASEWKIGVEEGGASFRLLPAPDTSDLVVKGTVSYVPATNASGIPSTVFDEWRHEIASGAVALLVLQPGRPWSNPQTYKMHRDIFDQGIRDASNMAGPVRRKRLRVKHAL